MKSAAGLSILLLLLLSVNVSGQINGAFITGNFNVLAVLTGDTLGSPEAGNHVDYEWFTAPATSIGTSGTYTIQATDQAKGIYIVATEKTAGEVFVRSFNSDTTIVNSFPVASNLSVVGDPRRGLTVWAAYIFTDANSDNEAGSTFIWYTANDQNGSGATAISPPATSRSYEIKDGDAGKYLGFSVTPGAAAGSTPGLNVMMSGNFVLVSSLNYAPEATVQPITGTLNTGDVLTGHYTYYDNEGDLESDSQYKWFRRSKTTDSWSEISGATAISYLITPSDTGKYFIFRVRPAAATGTELGIEYQSPSTLKSNNKPWVNYVYISGKDTVGQILTAQYQFHDDHDAEGTSIIQWYRNGVAISGATGPTYELTGYDYGKIITFRVTPVTNGTGEPVTGDEVTSTNSKGPVEDPASTPPTVADICIDGIREVDQYVYGKYRFVNNFDETSSGSKKLWFRGKTIVKTSTTSFRYKLVSQDIGSEIRFAVIPENDRGEKGDTVFSAPLAIFNIKDTFSETDLAYQLKAIPASNLPRLVGNFYGTAVDTGYFFPEIAGSTYSPFKLTYELKIFNDSTSCTQTAYKDVTVNPVTMEFVGIEDVYCDNHGEETVSVINVPALAVAWRFSISDPKAGLIPLNSYPVRDPAARFFPDQLVSGSNVILTFSYDVIFPFPSTYTKTRTLTINHIDSVSIQNLKPGDSFCFGDEPFELYGKPDDGVFSGFKTGSNIFNPSLMPGGYGDTTVTYTFTSSLGCQKSAIVPVRINPLPGISFEPEDFCILDANDSTKMKNYTPGLSVDPIISWAWEFSEGGITAIDTSEAPSFLYTTGGDHQIILTAVTANGCSATQDSTFDLGVKPVAGFTWKNECYHTGDSLLFFDATIAGSKIRGRTWVFDDTTVFNDVLNPKFPQKRIGYLPVSYNVTTGYEGCGDSIGLDVYIRPTITILKDGYKEGFEPDQGDWVPDYEKINSWKFGIPDNDSINSAASGVNAWFTKFDTTRIESSSVISPCFNFDSIARPMIKLWLFKRFDWNNDGAALQYKIGDVGSWEYVGTLEDGINWYNSTLIKGRPGGEQLGWTSDTRDITKWVESRHKLDQLAGKKDVKFRIIYGSNGDGLGNEGLAFDEIWIGERTRHVLLEHFANLSSLKSSSATNLVNQATGTNPMDIINIQYHTNFPGADAFYNDNPADNSARILYYGLIRAPYSYIDGGFSNEKYARIFDYNLASITSNDLVRRSLINPYFEITLASDTSRGILSVTGNIRALETINESSLTLYIAVTEKENNEHTGASGETLFYNVFRKMLPNAGGINLKTSWARDDEYTIPEYSWAMDKMKETSDIEVVAFIQNNITKEIFQAASEVRMDIVVGIEDQYVNGARGFSIWPNPAANKLTINFTEPLKHETDIRIYNLQGAVVSSFKAGADASQYTIDNLNLQQGLYLVRISQGGLDLGFRKLVVSGR